MKLTVIQASPHGMKGYTGRLLKPFLAAVKEAGVEVDLFSFDSSTVQPCRGCVEICHGKCACYLEDDCEKILQSMLAADGIVFAVPNYMFGVTAQLKALLDRLSFTLHCIFPVVALAVSTVFEGYRWSVPAFIGLAVLVAGNALALGGRARQATH